MGITKLSAESFDSLFDTARHKEVAQKVGLEAKSGAIILLEPGNGTRYEIIVCEIDQDNYFYVGIWPGLRASAFAKFSKYMPPHPGYVSEKLKVCDADAEVLASFIEGFSQRFS